MATKLPVIVEMFLLDTSKSMRRSNKWGVVSFLAGESRYDQAKAFISNHVRDIKGTGRFIGLITFSAKPILKIPIGNEEEILKDDTLDNMLGELETSGDTNLYDALDLAHDVVQHFTEGLLRRVEARFYVLTDGEDNITTPERKQEVVQKLGKGWPDGGLLDLNTLIILGFGNDSSQQRVRQETKFLPGAVFLNANDENNGAKMLNEILARAAERAARKLEKLEPLGEEGSSTECISINNDVKSLSELRNQKKTVTPAATLTIPNPPAAFSAKAPVQSASIQKAAEAISIPAAPRPKVSNVKKAPSYTGNEKKPGATGNFCNDPLLQDPELSTLSLDDTTNQEVETKQEEEEPPIIIPSNPEEINIEMETLAKSPGKPATIDDLFTCSTVTSSNLFD